MPRLQAGAATQAAARVVAESDKPITQTSRSREVMSDNADEAQQPAKPVAAKKPPARRPAAVKESMAKKPDPTPDEIVMSSLDEDDDYMVLVLYGPAGTRKTTSALRMTLSVAEGKILVIAAESGLKRRALQDHGVDTSRIVFWPERGKQVSYEGLENLFVKLLTDFERDPKSWAGISWDSLTEVIQTLVDQAAKADVERLQEIARVAKKNIEVRKVYERDGSDYQVATGQFRQLLRKFRSLPCHQIFIALEEDRKESVETDEGRRQKVGVIGPSLPPKIREDTEQHADVIGRLTVVDVNGVGPVGIGRFSPAEDLRAKDRYHVLPTVLLDPGWERIWGYVTGELKIGQDEVQAAAPVEVVAPAVESASEKAERVAASRAAKKPTAAPKGPVRRQSAKVTAESGTPDDPPM